jgi:hypothetical protein
MRRDAEQVQSIGCIPGMMRRDFSRALTQALRLVALAE